MRFDFHVRVDVHLHAPRDLLDAVFDIQRNQRKIMRKVDDALTTLGEVAEDVSKAVDELEALRTSMAGNLTQEQETKFDAAIGKLRGAATDARDGVDEAQSGGGDTGGGDTGGGDTGGGEVGGEGGGTAEATARRGR